jgi:hypothetical protein
LLIVRFLPAFIGALPRRELFEVCAINLRYFRGLAAAFNGAAHGGEVLKLLAVNRVVRRLIHSLWVAFGWALPRRKVRARFSECGGRDDKGECD